MDCGVALNPVARSSVTAFSQGAERYAREARLQQAVAWRLAHHCSHLPLGPGPVLDLGAGSGNLSRALAMQRPAIKPLLVDNCPALLAEAEVPQAQHLHWDLNQGLPPVSEGSSLLLSSFALHWLQRPAAQLRQWAKALAPQGWLALTVPVAGSLCSWHQAAQAAGVRCSALELPASEALSDALNGVAAIHQQQVLSFSCSYPRPMDFLRELRQLGVHGGATHQLRATELRQLLRHWPLSDDGRAVLRWRLLLLLARRL